MMTKTQKEICGNCANWIATGAHRSICCGKGSPHQGIETAHNDTCVRSEWVEKGDVKNEEVTSD